MVFAQGGHMTAAIRDTDPGVGDFFDDPIIIDLRQLTTVLIKATGYRYQLNTTAHVLLHILPVHIAGGLTPATQPLHVAGYQSVQVTLNLEENGAASAAAAKLARRHLPTDTRRGARLRLLVLLFNVDDELRLL